MRKSTISNFDHLLKYESPTKAKTFRSTQIITTIDVESDEEKLQAMIEAGMNVACFDYSQASIDAIERTIGKLRNALRSFNEQRNMMRRSGDSGDIVEMGCDISMAIALNLKAPSLLTGRLKNGEKFFLQTDQTVNLTNNRDYTDNCDANWIYVNYPQLSDLHPSQIIFLGASRIKLMVENLNPSEAFVCCRILKGGISDLDPMEVLIPGVKINLPPVDRDFLDTLEFAKRNQVDTLFASINDQFAFETIKCHLKSESISLVAKIESQAAYDNLENFLEHADGILISRYKLSLDMGTTEKAIAAQKCIISKCLKAGVPSIVSSNILRKMRETGANEPSSAEISDIFNATMDGCDCIVLDSYTVQCIQTLQDTILESEQMINHRRWFHDLLTHVSAPSDISSGVAISACISALVSDASAIIVYTTNGDIVRLIAKYRPESLIVVVTSSASFARRSLLLRGVRTIHFKDKTENHLKNVEMAIEIGLQFIRQRRIISKYPSSVIAVYAQKEGLLNTNTMQIISIPDRLSRNSIEISPRSSNVDDVSETTLNSFG